MWYCGRVPHPFACLWRKDGNKTPEPVFHITLDDGWRIEATRYDARLSHPTKRRLSGAPGTRPKLASILALVRSPGLQLRGVRPGRQDARECLARQRASTPRLRLASHW